MLLLVRTARSKARGGERGVSGTYRLGITRDFLSLLRPEGELEPAEIGLDLLDGQPGLEVEYLSESPEVLAPEQVADYDALLMLANVPRLPAEAIASSRRLLHVARFGVGYDNVDVDACTEAGVLVTITPDGVRRAMSGAALTFILALSRKLLAKDRLTREGRWAERFAYNGVGLTGRTLGVVGLGNIGRDILKLATPHEMRHLAFDPYVSSEDAGELGVELVELDELLAASDFVCLACMLNDETRHLMNADRLALMKPTAYLVNVARGGVVDQAALLEALRERRIAGAGLDVFEQEPIDPDDPILELDNVIVTPHAIGSTDESLRGIGRSACQSVIDVAAGRVPQYIVNRDVLDLPRFVERLERRAQEAPGRR